MVSVNVAASTTVCVRRHIDCSNLNYFQIIISSFEGMHSSVVPFVGSGPSGQANFIRGYVVIFW